MRFATDTGGTFTDLVIEDDQGNLHMYKSPTTPNDPVAGVLNALQVAADDMGLSLDALMSKGDTFIHGTTHALNAIIEGQTAKTAFITTKGHKDILLMREGGRLEPFNHAQQYPAPYIPRSLSYAVSERIHADGNIQESLKESDVLEAIEAIKSNKVEAVSVCLLWSVVNPTHELEIAKLLEQHLPGIPYSLSHQLNPVMREYRRASATSIDASLKPLMSSYLGGLTERLRNANYKGRILVLTSQGGMLDAELLAQTPIQVLNSGPAMAPVAGGYYGSVDDIEGKNRDIIVADTGGTTYDVSLVRNGVIPLTREMWIGKPYLGHITGFPSVDITSVGAGGGSIAWVDAGGILHVGPQSQGAKPGPACYNLGGDKATVTDAAVALGYIDPDFFLGGKMQLDGEASKRVIQQNVANKLGISLLQASAAIIKLATENMAQAIIDITVNQGVDPTQSVLIGGGGAAGLNSIFIARRLDCPELIVPEVGATMSAAGATIADLSADYHRALFVRSNDFDFESANILLSELYSQCQAFIDASGQDSFEQSIEFSVEARYENQVWEIDIPLSNILIIGVDELNQIVEEFHRSHERLFSFSDPNSAIEIVNWSAKVRCRLRSEHAGRLVEEQSDNLLMTKRKTYFDGYGSVETPIYRFSAMPIDKIFKGPAIVESPFTSIVVDPVATFTRSLTGNLIIKP
ncbi:hydantoinase/oxoprolinase family protein [Paraglaciecola arctica]|uniref:hydantoinase/oxoprolinase family protein n=1 Tax=Paraglaciecola arctica TaxID=1128911 RepID=UPI001C06F681|nr:hydantoinase/oxoprolinase family protein [Paraglaciecola arctica]MBU3004256.1 hydantoinase/oxoprolinase family protein [Paraglaciecola arctica]